MSRERARVASREERECPACERDASAMSRDESADAQRFAAATGFASCVLR